MILRPYLSNQYVATNFIEYPIHKTTSANLGEHRKKYPTSTRPYPDVIFAGVPDTPRNITTEEVGPVLVEYASRC